MTTSEGNGTPGMVLMECSIPDTHQVGQKLSWLSPTGKRVAIHVPPGAEAGQSLEFFVPEDICNAKPELPQPDANTVELEITVPQGWQQGNKLMATLESGQRVMISAPEGTLPGMTLEFTVPQSALKKTEDTGQNYLPPDLQEQEVPSMTESAQTPGELAVELREEGGLSKRTNGIFGSSMRSPWLPRATGAKYSMDAVREKVNVASLRV